MKAPTVATLYPRHGDFAAKNGSEPPCSVTSDLDCGALPRGVRQSGPGHGRTRVWPGVELREIRSSAEKSGG